MVCSSALNIENWTIEELESLIEEFKANQENFKSLEVLADTNNARQFEAFQGERIQKISIRQLNQNHLKVEILDQSEVKVCLQARRLGRGSNKKVSRHRLASQSVQK